MSARRTLFIAAPFLAATLLLAACVPAGDSDATAKPTSSPSTTPAPASNTPGPEASPAPTVETGEPVGVGCNDLITPQQMYDYNPNFGLAADFTPDAGTLAAQAVAASGLACRWVNQTSGDTIDVSVAHLDSASTSRRAAELAATSTPVTVFGPDGYFDQGDLGSAAQAFPGEFWVSASSIAFFTVEDAGPIMNAATAAVS